MSETSFFDVGDYNWVKATTYLALIDEVKDLCASNALVSTAREFYSWLPREIYEDKFNFPLRKNVLIVPVVRLFSLVHFALWFLSSI